MQRISNRRGDAKSSLHDVRGTTTVEDNARATLRFERNDNVEKGLFPIDDISKEIPTHQEDSLGIKRATFGC